MALFPSGGAAVKGRVLASFPSLVEGSGGISVSKQNGVWTIEPGWGDLAIETTLADASARQLWIYNPVSNVYTRLSVQYLLDNLPAGPSGDDGSLIYEQTSAPATDKPANSLWIDSDSTDLDVYQLVAGVWTDTGINLKGTAGATGASYAGTSVSSQAIGNSGTKTFTTQTGLAYQAGTRIRAADASSPTVNWMEGVVTSYSSTTLAFTADKSLGSGTLTDWTLNVAGQYGADGAGTGDFSSNTATSVDSEIVLFSSTTGKIGKRATTTGILKGTSGVLSAATAGTDYLEPPSGSAILKANSGGALANASSGTDYVAPGGALGTPSSGTLTNCTGLPVAGITASTSTALGVGSVELGHASNTTLSQYAAGILGVEGVALYPNIPLTSKSAAYTTVLADANTGLLHPSADTTARTWTIDSNTNVAYPVGTVLTFVNQASAGTLTISITSDTMRLAGAGTTGSRTLAANGVATAVKVTSTEWLINGTNLT
jgi:hypothetical protein